MYILYNRGMKTISTTNARKIFGKLIESVYRDNSAILIGKRNVPEAVLIKFPSEFNSCVDEITNINAYSGSFDFLAKEPEIYSRKDIKKSYA